MAAGAVLALMLRPSPAPATVQEQRARLPPAAECPDPIEGTWMGLSYYPNHGQWYEFTLEIHRVAGSDTDLTGTILAHFWDGAPEVSEPGACGGGQRIKIFEEAAGTFAADHVQFGGTSWKLQEAVCGRFSGAYAFDIFKGTLDPAIEEFQSVNDWDASDYDEPTVFRRIRCLDGPALDDKPVTPPADVKPPPFYPRERSGC